MSEQNKPNQRAINIILVIAGLACGIVGVGYTYFAYTYSQSVISTNGIVTQKFVDSRNIGKRIYNLTIDFSDQLGAPHRGQVSMTDPDFDLPVGTEIIILYDPNILNDLNSLSQIKVDTWFEVWGIGFIFSMVGLFTILVMFLAYRDKKSQQPNKFDAQQRKPVASPEDVERIAAVLRKLGRHDEADEVLKKIQSADKDARDLH